MLQNKMRRKLTQNLPTFGVSIMIPSPQLVHIVAKLGFAWVLIACDHGTMNPQTAEVPALAAQAKGMDIDDFAPRLSFFFGCHNDFFEEVAKFRAARRLWHRLMNERYQPNNPKSSMLRFHTQTAGITLTAQQPLHNVARVASQANAAVLG